MRPPSTGHRMPHQMPQRPGWEEAVVSPVRPVTFQVPPWAAGGAEREESPVSQCSTATQPPNRVQHVHVDLEGIAREWGGTPAAPMFATTSTSTTPRQSVPPSGRVPCVDIASLLQDDFEGSLLVDVQPHHPPQQPVEQAPLTPRTSLSTCATQTTLPTDVTTQTMTPPAPQPQSVDHVMLPLATAADFESDAGTDASHSTIIAYGSPKSGMTTAWDLFKALEENTQPPSSAFHEQRMFSDAKRISPRRGDPHHRDQHHQGNLHHRERQTYDARQEQTYNEAEPGQELQQRAEHRHLEQRHAQREYPKYQEHRQQDLRSHAVTGEEHYQARPQQQQIDFAPEEQEEDEEEVPGTMVPIKMQESPPLQLATKRAQLKRRDGRREMFGGWKDGRGAVFVITPPGQEQWVCLFTLQQAGTEEPLPVEQAVWQQGGRKVKMLINPTTIGRAATLPPSDIISVATTDTRGNTLTFTLNSGNGSQRTVSLSFQAVDGKRSTSCTLYPVEG